MEISNLDKVNKKSIWEAINRYCYPIIIIDPSSSNFGLSIQYLKKIFRFKYILIVISNMIIYLK